MSNLAASPDAYRQGAVLAATPGELIVMLYDGARRFLRQASVAMREGEIERAHNTLRRAELIIAHLDGILDFEQGEVAERLHAIYQFCLAHLNVHATTKTPASWKRSATCWASCARPGPRSRRRSPAREYPAGTRQAATSHCAPTRRSMSTPSWNWSWWDAAR